MYNAPSPETAMELTLYTSEGFFRSLSEDLAATGVGDRVAITTMDFDVSDPLVRHTYGELSAAADRGVDIAFGVDAFAFLNPRRTIGSVVLPFALGREARKHRLEPFTALAEKATVQASVTNEPKPPVLNYFAARSHLKIAVVNDRLYLGGPSFQGSDRIDMMVGFEDKTTADWLYGLASAVASSGSTKAVLGEEDQVRSLDSHTRVIIDAGRQHQSRILEEVLKVIDEAESHLLISSPFLLTGAASEHVLQAYQRGIDVHLASLFQYKMAVKGATLSNRFCR